MLYWAAVFFVISVITACFGFGGVATAAAAGTGKVLFIVFLVLALVSLVFGHGSSTFARREPVVPGDKSLVRPYYFIPLCTGLAAYCFSHEFVRPSASMALGVFFTSVALVLGVKSISQSSNGVDYE